MNLPEKANETCIAQIADALFGEPGLSLMEISNRGAEIEQMAKDAGRYAWIRDRSGQHDQQVEVFINDELYAPGHLDAQVDEAMKEQAE